MEILQNFVAFSEYMNFTMQCDIGADILLDSIGAPLQFVTGQVSKCGVARREHHGKCNNLLWDSSYAERRVY